MPESAETRKPAPDSEARIFDAARTVFFQQGYDGARMEEIARRADVNKALLHYYYRSKRQLFLLVFRAAVGALIPHIVGLIGDDQPIDVKLRRFIDAYVGVALKNPQLPGFMFEEVRRNPDWLTSVVKQHTDGLFAKLSAQIEAEAAAGRMRRIPAEQLLANLLALCAFPFLARPVLQALARFDDAQYDAFLKARREEVYDFVKRAIQP